MPGWAIVTLDVLALGAALCVFALFHHVLPRAGGGPKLSIVNVQPSVGGEKRENPAQESANAAAETTAGDFSAAFPVEDTGAGADYSYQSGAARIAVTRHDRDGAAYYVADVWVKNIASLRTAFAQNQYGQGIHQEFMKMAQDNKAILAVSGDYYGARAKGVVVRNGQLYRDSLFEDVCVLYEDGVMETYTADTFSLDDAVTRKAYQIWSFGPRLLDNGQPMQAFSSTVTKANPRCAIGYYQPGHYCFVLVDGRQPGYSDGMTLQALSGLFHDLGCKAAYNLDGGQTAMMEYEGKLVNRPYNGGRQSSDIIFISE